MKTENETKQVAAIYCRVSTHEQGKGDFSSLNSQEDLLRKYCQQKGWAVYNVYTDTKTGTTLERDELNNLIRDAEQGRFNIVAITKLDRISRSIKDFLDLDARLRSLDVDIVVATQHIDTTTPAGKMQRTIMLAFAEFERDMIADRTREKLYSQAQKGFWGGGMVLLGYDVVDKKLIVNEEEAKLVRRVFQYYLEEPSSNKVALRLNKEGYKTKKRKSKENKVSGGGSFNHQNVQYILKSKVYLGIITNRGEDFKGLHEPIVDIQTFNDVQNEMAKSRLNPLMTFSDSDLLLLGLVKCGYCGKNLTTTYATGKNGERYFYYKCSSKSKFGASKCESADLPADKFEDVVEKVLIHLGTDDKFFNAVAAQMDDNGNDELIKMRESLAELKGNQGLNTKQTANLVNTLANKEESVPTKPIIEKLNLLETERTTIEEMIVQIERQIEIITTYNIPKDQLKLQYQRLSQVYKDLPAEKKKRLAKTMISSVESFLKKKENKGKLKFTFRGDGTMEMEWQKKGAPETSVSSALIGWLRG
ncbi:MAG: recombinase family protein [Bacteroidota bacterium]|nr:recombinase family protein [Bacteroidota bacterium]